MKRINLKLVLAFIATLGLLFAASAQHFMSGGIGFQVLSTDDHTVEVTMKQKCAPYSGNITIPATVAHGGIEYTVVSLGEEAFYRASFTGITIPSSVTQIKGCGLAVIL